MDIVIHDWGKKNRLSGFALEHTLLHSGVLCSTNVTLSIPSIWTFEASAKHRQRKMAKATQSNMHFRNGPRELA